MKNNYEIHDDIVVIHIKRRDGTIHCCIIDLEDLDKVSKYSSWCIHTSTRITGKKVITGVFTNVYKEGKRGVLLLHQLLLTPSPDFVVDHKNHKVLDNRKSNLRIVTYAQNGQNRTKANAHSKSGVRGVWWDEPRGKWGAGLKINRKQISLGYYDDLAEAAKVVVEARRKYMPFSIEASSGNS